MDPVPTRPPRLNRHDRLWSFQAKCAEIGKGYAEDPARGALLFAQAKKEFLAEGWTVNHFQSPESRELLIQLNGYFRGRDGAPPVDSLGGFRTKSRPLAAATMVSPNKKEGRVQIPPPIPVGITKKEMRMVLIVAAAILLVFLVLIATKGPAPTSDLLPALP